MEGLIKGLIDVALGHDNNNNNNNNNNNDEQPGQQDRDEQSRSTWAQVSNNNTAPSIFFFITLLPLTVAKLRRWWPGSKITTRKTTIGVAVIALIMLLRIRTVGIDRFIFPFPFSIFFFLLDSRFCFWDLNFSGIEIKWNVILQENAELGNEEWRVSGSRPSRSPQYQKVIFFFFFFLVLGFISDLQFYIA